MFPGIFGFAAKIGSAIDRIRRYKQLARSVRQAYKSDGIQGGLRTLEDAEVRPRTDAQRVMAGTHKGTYHRGRLVKVAPTDRRPQSRETGAAKGHVSRRDKRRFRRGARDE